VVNVGSRCVDTPFRYFDTLPLVSSGPFRFQRSTFELLLQISTLYYEKERIKDSKHILDFPLSLVCVEFNGYGRDQKLVDKQRNSS